MAEEVRLESVCTPKGYRGFESLPLRKMHWQPMHYEHKGLNKELKSLFSPFCHLKTTFTVPKWMNWNTENCGRDIGLCGNGFEDCGNDSDKCGGSFGSCGHDFELCGMLFGKRWNDSELCGKKIESRGSDSVFRGFLSDKMTLEIDNWITYWI